MKVVIPIGQNPSSYQKKTLDHLFPGDRSLRTVFVRNHFHFGRLLLEVHMMMRVIAAPAAGRS